MAQPGKKIRILVIFLLFVVYFFIAARPIPRETILAPLWLSSLESDAPVSIGVTDNPQERLVPFSLGSRFGYVDSSGNFALKKMKAGDIYYNENQWTEYGARPAAIEIKNIAEEAMVSIENPGGYPILLDNRVFILGSEQNSLSEIGAAGNILWTYEFGAPLTCIDAAAGLVLTGSIDGIIEIINSSGKRIFYFEPGGSRYSAIFGCALSRDGLRLGIVCGIDQQRFLLFERYGNEGDYKIVYHEFTGDGFRRPVHVLFIDQDQRVVFERPGGIGSYSIKSRQTIHIPLSGEIAAIDESGDKGFFFLITSRSPNQKELIGIKFPQERFITLSGNGRDSHNAIFLKAPFKSDDVCLGRNGSMVIAGGGTTLISFALEEK